MPIYPCSPSAASLRGDNSLMGYDNRSCTPLPGDAWGDAVELDTRIDAKICMNISPDFTTEELEQDTIGCGGTSGFGTESNFGKREYRFNLEGDVGYQNGWDRFLAQFFGTVTNQGEQTLGQRLAEVDRSGR